jgi:hypothetical protein
MGTAVSALEKVLLRRNALVVQAEQEAAMAAELALMAEKVGSDDLLSVSEVTTALEHTARSHAGAYLIWAEAAKTEDRLLARSLEAVAETLHTLAEQAHAAVREASEYVESLQHESPAA